MGLGAGVTVTRVMAEQPAARVYVIKALPLDTPVTAPVVETEPTRRLLLLQVPPDATSDKAVDCPTQVAIWPEIRGSAFTETIFVAVQPEGIA